MLSRPFVVSVVLALTTFINCDLAGARTLKSSVSEVGQIPALQPQYPVPKEPNMLFYIQRSANSNTVIYAANLDAQGRPNPGDPVNVYWRWYNVDGHKKPLNFFERMMAFGVNVEHQPSASNAIAFNVAALPEMQMFLERDSRGGPEAVVQMGGHMARLVYAYLQVDDHGFMPDVRSIDLFGVDTATGRALHEHIARD